MLMIVRTPRRRPTTTGKAGTEKGPREAVEAKREREVRGDDDPDQVDREEVSAAKPGSESDGLGVGRRDPCALDRPAAP